MRSRYQVHAEIRRVFARHWIDLDRIHFGEYRGMVRVTGELHTTQLDGWDPSISILDVLRSQIIRIPEVRHVQFDLLNWARDEDGLWSERTRLDGSSVEEQLAALSASEDTEREGDGGSNDDD